MTKELIPTKIKIDGKWYNARQGFGSTVGMLNLSDSGKIAQITEFTAKEPYIHISNFYFVYDINGSKVGEIDIRNRRCSGRVNDFEIPGRSGSVNSSNSGFAGFFVAFLIGIIGFILGVIIKFIVRLVKKATGA